MQIDVDVPDARSGQWAVETFDVSKEDADWFNFRAIMSHSGGTGLSRRVTPGRYKRLVRYEEKSNAATVVMSNTPAEIRDHFEFIVEARRSKKVLINGLGLGVALKAILESTFTEEVIVVEKEIDVISMVGPYIQDDRVRIHHADAFTFKPPMHTRFGAVWHDIWDSMCEDNLPQMATLHRRYGRKADWQGSWGKQECRRMRDW